MLEDYYKELQELIKRKDEIIKRKNRDIATSQDTVYKYKEELNKVIDEIDELLNNNEKLEQLLEAAEQSEQEATEIVAELKAENVKLKEKYQEELTVNTQLREWQDEDLRQIKELTVERNRLFGENAILLEENKKLKELLETRCYNEVEFENKKLKEALETIKTICRPLLKLDNIEKLEGKHLTGKYNLAKNIMEVLKDE